MGQPRSMPALGVLAILIVANAAGCGLFSPRDPRPGGGPGVTCITPNSPDSVVANVVGHYAEFAGVSCYTDMLDTAFIFHPDIADSQEGGAVFVNWTQAIETRDARDIAGNATFHAVSFDSEYAARVISGDLRTQTRFYAYHLIIHSQQTPPPDTLFQGLADITFFQGPDAQWHITNWVDKRDGSGARTWGYLRSQFRTGF